MPTSRTLIVIPARMASKRFPGKPMAMVCGKPLVHRTYLRAEKAGANLVVMTTPDDEIEQYCYNNGLTCIASPLDCLTGTHRCSEVANREDGYDVVVNWQVDEPLVEPIWVDRLVAEARDRWMICTLIAPIGNNQWQDENVVKVSVSNDYCHWFSRGHLRGALGHIGVYAYPRETLLELGRLKSTALSQAEGLEQLVWLENHFPIRAVQVGRLPLSINVPKDLDKLQLLLENENAEAPNP